MKVHLFGAASSPSCANSGIKKVATDYETDILARAASFIKEDFYVDDGLTSMPSKEEAIALISETQHMCKKGGPRLYKFVLNSSDALEGIPESDRAQGTRDLHKEALPIEHALGMQWCIQSDTFQFQLT